MSEIQMFQTKKILLNLVFEFGICFGFRYSSFGFEIPHDPYAGMFQTNGQE